MKTLLIITLFSSFQISTVFSGNPPHKTTFPTMYETICHECLYLTPDIPLEATYEDQKAVTTLIENESLVPQVPMQADFNDSKADSKLGTSSLSPVVPREADFRTTL
jgi:hypothetical protein